MATFIPPEIDPDEKHPESELTVYRRLREALSDDWVVFYSFCLVRHSEQNGTWDHEIDFLLYHEWKGFLVLEVKGGAIAYRQRQWFQNDIHIRSPFEQALGNKFAIMKMLERKLGRAVPLRFAHAVCFTGCTSRARNWPAEAEGLVITATELNQDIEALFIQRIEETNLPRALTGTISRGEILAALSPEFEYHPPLRDVLLAEAEDFTRLTRQQYTVIDALRNFPRLLIRGGAGTGKTMLAIHKAESIAAEGGRVLFLCYNELLARKIIKGNQKRGVCFQVSAFFDFCVWALQIPGEEYDRYRNEPTLYSDVLPRLMLERGMQRRAVYDAVIVDEGQDFSPQMWEIVVRLLAPHTLFYVFYDPDQNIFREQLSLPSMTLPPIDLTVNCRNTRRIHEAMEPYCTTGTRPAEGSPTGPEVRIRTGEMRSLLAQELERLCKMPHAMQGDLVVLGGHSLDNTSLGTDHQVGKYRLVETVGELETNDIRYLTYMKFKGCEANFVILLDVDENDPRWNHAGLYTAMSRARHELVILKPNATAG